MIPFRVLLASVLLCVSAAADTVGLLRVEPHSYPSSVVNNPAFQMVTNGRLRWFKSENWEVETHIEAETQGRRDVIFDVDRAWYQLPLGDSVKISLGRIHPFDVSKHFLHSQPWSLLTSRQSQNQGLLLGSGLRADTLSSSPTLLGWLGVHGSVGTAENWGFAFSATPFFIPSLGPEIIFSDNAPAYWGRFARRVPERVSLSGNEFPVILRIDRSRLFTDVILQPQAMGQAWWKYSKEVRAWATLSRSPSPDGEFPNESYLQVTENNVVAFALVHAKFRQRWEASLTHHVEILNSISLWNTLLVASDSHYGGEVGMRAGPVSFSLLHEWMRNPAPDAYRDLLGQLDLRQELLGVEGYLGFKRHFRQNDLWMRFALRFALAKETKLDIGTDLFSGSDHSYFGEWRANDRAFVALQWELGT